MERLRRFATYHGLFVVEDACQAHGSMWNGKFAGTWGDAGCFSLHDGKLMSTGEGGFILTNSLTLARKCLHLRNHCIDPNRASNSFRRIGMNYRLTALQAIIGRSELAGLETRVKRNKEITESVLEKISNVPELKYFCPSEQQGVNYYSLLLLVADRNIPPRAPAIALARLGVANSVGTYGLRPLPEWSAFRAYRADSKPGHLSNTKLLLNRVLAITIPRRQATAHTQQLSALIPLCLREYRS